MINYVIGAVLLLIAGGITFYLIRARRRGEKCIGCPYAKQCGGKCAEKAAARPEEKEQEAMD